MSGLTAVAFLVAPSVTFANPPEGADSHDAAEPDTDAAAPEKAPAPHHATKKTAKASSGSDKASPKKMKKGRRVKETASATLPPKSKKAKKAKKTASRGNASSKKSGGKAAADVKAPPPCLGPAVALDRGGEESESLVLVDCHGAPRLQAGARLSVLARPWGTNRPAKIDVPAQKTKKSNKKTAASDEPEDVAPGIRRLDAGLLSRIDAIARKFPGKTISVVSGYRPQSRGSLHQSGRAIDLRVADVDNRTLVDFCRTLTDTGCGFYPNSSFVHVDVRPSGTGVVHWIDASGPGEAPRYVTHWPPASTDKPAQASPSPTPSPAPSPATPAPDPADPAPSASDPPAPEIPSVDMDPYDPAADEAPKPQKPTT